MKMSRSKQAILAKANAIARNGIKGDTKARAEKLRAELLNESLTARLR